MASGATTASLMDHVDSALNEARDSYREVTVALVDDALEGDYREQLERSRDLLGEAIDSLGYVAINLEVERVF